MGKETFPTSSPVFCHLSPVLVFQPETVERELMAGLGVSPWVPPSPCPPHSTGTSPVHGMGRQQSTCLASGAQPFARARDHGRSVGVFGRTDVNGLLQTFAVNTQRDWGGGPAPPLRFDPLPLSGIISENGLSERRWSKVPISKGKK